MAAFKPVTMKIKLHWPQKLQAFRNGDKLKKNRLIATVLEGSENKDLATSNVIRHSINVDSGTTSSRLPTVSSIRKGKQKQGSKLSRVVASFGCGSTAYFHRGSDRNRPKQFSEEEDNPQTSPQSACDKFRVCEQTSHPCHYCEGVSMKDCCMHVHTKRLAESCKCMHDLGGSGRSEGALLSRKPQKEFRNQIRVAAETGIPLKGDTANCGRRVSDLSVGTRPLIAEAYAPVEAKLRSYLPRVEGSFSDRIITSHQKKSNAQAESHERWSSASVRDYFVLNGNHTPDYKMEDSSLYGSFMKQRSSEKRRQHQSLTSISTLSSYDFDTVSSWGPHDLTNVSFGSPNTGYVHLNPSSSPGWNHKGNIDEGSREQSMQRRSLSSWIPDPDVSVVSYTLSDYEMESEDEKNLQETISYSKPWPNPNEESDHNNCDKYGDNGDYGYDDHAECLIDMEANAKAWAMAWELSTSNPSLPVTKDFGVGPLLRCDRLGDSCRSKRELNAAALKRKYYREFAEKHQAVVVSSHYEDNINTFTFPYASDYDDGASLIPLKLFDDAETELDVSYHNDLMDAYKSHERAEEKHVYHSLAIEKKSENPYLDFRDSMVEMVLEKQMHKSSELEELLQSFLSLNSLEYHELIVQAFSEVWEKVFGSTNTFHWKS